MYKEEQEMDLLFREPAPHPRVVLREEMSIRCTEFDELLNITGLTRDALWGFWMGDEPVTEALATALGSWLNQPASYWLELQSAYDADQTAIREWNEEMTAMTVQMNRALRETYDKVLNAAAPVRAAIAAGTFQHPDYSLYEGRMYVTVQWKDEPQIIYFKGNDFAVGNSLTDDREIASWEYREWSEEFKAFIAEKLTKDATAAGLRVS